MFLSFSRSNCFCGVRTERRLRERALWYSLRGFHSTFASGPRFSLLASAAECGKRLPGLAAGGACLPGAARPRLRS